MIRLSVTGTGKAGKIIIRPKKLSQIKAHSWNLTPSIGQEKVNLAGSLNLAIKQNTKTL